MVWLTWRQHRVQVLATVGLLLVLGVFMLVRGAEAEVVLGWLPIVPALVGMFWGAPLLAREVERGTHRLAWTQSVTRRHWLVAKLGVLGVAVTVTGLALGLMVTAWTRAYDVYRFEDAAFFSGTGVAVGAWWLFAFLLGTATGSVVRRVLPALAITVALFVVTMFVIFGAREDYAEPVRQVTEAQPAAGSFVTGSSWVSPSGEEIEYPPECANAGRDEYIGCIQDAGYRTVLYYQPADRYWQFQWTEAGILSLAAVVLAVPVAYRVLRRPV